MINLLYVGLAVAASVVASIVMVLRNRRPRSLESGVDEFSRELQALAPGTAAGGRHRRRSRAG